MIAFAFSATVLNYVHRLSFTYLAAHPDLRPLFSDTTFGLMGTAFFVAYTLSNGLCGFAIRSIIDKQLKPTPPDP